MIVNVGRVGADGKHQPPAYVCQACTRIRRKQETVDSLVSTIIVARLALPDALGALAVGNVAEAERSRDQMAALDARLELAADQFADGVLTGAQLRRITDRIRPQIEAARGVVNANMPAPWVAEMAGRKAANKWEAATLDVRRTLVDMLCTVTILPVGPGHSFNPASIRIDWKA